VEPAAALNRAAPLARGLAAVHAAGLAFGSLDGRVQGDGDLFLADFAAVGPGSATAYEADVRSLAGLVYRMLTGRAEVTPGVAAPLADRLASLMQGRATTNAADLAALLSSRAAGLRRPESLDLRVGRRTDVGQLRELNEDSLLTLDLVWSNKSISRPVGLFVVADGMGGHEGGEIASGLLVRAVAQHATSELLPRTTAAGGEPMDYGAWLTAAIQAGNVEVFDRSQTAGNDMGTTVVAALVAGNEAYVAHVGDSRAYRINAAGIEQITVDHSLVESLVASNQITREEARHHPQSNVIYRTIGDKRQVTVDLDLVTLAPGDSLLLCSDGLSGMVTDDDLQRLVATAPSPQAACDALIDAANRAGGEDNITAIIIRAEALS
jgi:protein phosphatase